MRWAEIEIEAAASAADAAGNVLLSAGCAGFAVRDTQTPPTIAGYLPVDDRLELKLRQIQDALDNLPSFGIPDAGTELTLRYVEEADWANAWKAYFKPIRIGRNLIVTPPWEAPELGPNDITIVVDPGMAFGTGSHPTTQLCLAALENTVRQGMRVADIGTGSGILAIATAKLGASEVVATDVDPIAVTIARENAVVNGVEITVSEQPPDGFFDLVVANILADVIIGMAEQLAAWTRHGGTLIVSGIIDTRATDVAEVLTANGFHTLETRYDADWVALICRPEKRAGV